LPKYYYLDELRTASSTTQRFGVWERPGTELENGLRAWYYRKPNTTASFALSSQLEVPEWATSLVLYYMLHLAYTADTKLISDDAAAVYYLLYEDVLDRLIMRSKDRQPKDWISGSAMIPSFNVLNRLPGRVPAP
jgi:hypothetical protein